VGSGLRAEGAEAVGGRGEGGRGGGEGESGGRGGRRGGNERPAERLRLGECGGGGVTVTDYISHRD
jgi:hypothetical protein